MSDFQLLLNFCCLSGFITAQLCSVLTVRGRPRSVQSVRVLNLAQIFNRADGFKIIFTVRFEPHPVTPL